MRAVVRSGLILLLAVTPFVALYADSLGKFFTADTVAKLRAGRTLSASVSADRPLILLPGAALGPGIAAETARARPTVGVELLRLVTGTADPLDTPAGLLTLFNNLHAVSTLKGVTYYSVTRKNSQVLFSQSFAVSDPQKNTRIPDPWFEILPPSDVMYTFQEDNSFGRNSYQETFESGSDHVSVKIENLTTISLLFVPIIRPRNLVSYVTLIPVGRDLAFYGLAYLSTSVPLGDLRSREESLLNRLKAMERWLAARLKASP